MAYTYSKISTYTVGSGGIPSVFFINIPQTYTDLVVKVSGRNSTNGTNNWSLGYLEFNNDSGANYAARYGHGNGAGTASGLLGGMYDVHSGNTSTANTFGNTEIYIPNYSSSNYKSYSSEYGMEDNAISPVFGGFLSGLWSSTAAITSIRFYGAGNWLVNSTFHLYGIKAEL